MGVPSHLYAARIISRGIELTYDRASDTYVLGPKSVAEVEATLADGTLACVVAAREFHGKNRVEEAHRIQLLLHLRGVETNNLALCRAAANICLEAAGCAPLKPAREPS